MAENTVTDEERLYRNVRGNIECDKYNYSSSGELIVTRNAFKDTNKSPSVDRAILLGNDPNKSKKSPSDGIVMLVTAKVRKIGDVFTSINDDEKVFHSVNVIPDHTEDNRAHALVTVDPDFFASNNKQEKAFKRLKIALARLATKNGWTIEPNN